MMIKTINVTLDVVVAFSVWCAAIVVAAVMLHVAIMGSVTACHLLGL